MALGETLQVAYLGALVVAQLADLQVAYLVDYLMDKLAALLEIYLGAQLEGLAVD